MSFTITSFFRPLMFFILFPFNLYSASHGFSADYSASKVLLTNLPSCQLTLPHAQELMVKGVMGRAIITTPCIRKLTVDYKISTAYFTDRGTERCTAQGPWSISTYSNETIIQVALVNKDNNDELTIIKPRPSVQPTRVPTIAKPLYAKYLFGVALLATMAVLLWYIGE